MATELGKAYVQIMPSAKGISGAIQKELDPESAVAGKSAGGKVVGALKGVIATAAIGTAIGAALTKGGELQQSLGGVETLFKENAGKVKQYANEAYRTAGLSANAYMENVTSFSASLLQSTAGDTEKAAEKANMAMIDMSDNANKFGTNMGSIQDAYQGFAKQNYTMLDNLKLGYGGTKSEMERLLADAQKLTGVKYDINNLSDVYEAIHVVQEELGVTGTTAKESAETLGGSLASMKGAFENVLGNLALGKDIGPSLKALSETVSTFLFNNLLPMVSNILEALPDVITTLTGAIIENLPLLVDTAMQIITSLISGIGAALPQLIPAAVNAVVTIVQGLVGSIPLVLDAALQLILGLAQGILDALPQLIEALPAIILGIVDFLISAIPQIIDAGIQLLVSLIGALPEIITAIVAAIPQIILALTTAIVGSIPQLVQAGIQLFVALIQNLPTIIVEIVKAIPQIIAAIVKGFTGSIGEIAQVGGDLIRGLWRGINNTKDWILGKIKGFGRTILNGMKDFFGIGSPSKVFEDEVGKWLPMGIGKGIENNIQPVTSAMRKLAQKTMDSYDIVRNTVAASAQQMAESLNPINLAIAGTGNIGSTSTPAPVQTKGSNRRDRSYADGQMPQNITISVQLPNGKELARTVYPFMEIMLAEKEREQARESGRL